MDLAKVNKDLENDILRIKLRNCTIAFLFFLMQLIFVIKPIQNKSNIMLSTAWATLVLFSTIILLSIITKNNISNSISKVQKMVDIYIYNENSTVLKMNKEVLEYRLQAIENINVFQEFKFNDEDDFDDYYELINRIDDETFDTKELKSDLKNTIINLKEKKEKFSLLLDSSLMKELRIDRIISELEMKRKEILENTYNEDIVAKSAMQIQKEIKLAEKMYESIIKLLKARILY